MRKIEDLTKEELLDYIKVLGVNWLAHDGCWFLSAEEKFDMKTAKQINDASWYKFTRVEAKRIMKFLGIEPGGGVPALAQALAFRLYAHVNEQEILEMDDRKLVFRMNVCRVQAARTRKGLEPYPCKSAGIVEYTGFAETIDPRFRTRCRYCPPDEIPSDGHCAWEFTLEEVDEEK